MDGRSPELVKKILKPNVVLDTRTKGPQEG